MKFEVADIWLKVDDRNNVRVTRVTPPEAQYFILRYQGIAKGNPIDHIAKRGHIDKAPMEMKSFLNKRFGTDFDKAKGIEVPRIDAVYQGASPNLPGTFEELYMSDGQGGTQKWSPNHDGRSPKSGPLIDDVVPATFEFAAANRIEVSEAKEVTQKRKGGKSLKFMRVTWPDGSTEDILKETFDKEYVVKGVVEAVVEEEATSA